MVFSEGSWRLEQLSFVDSKELTSLCVDLVALGWCRLAHEGRKRPEPHFLDGLLHDGCHLGMVIEALQLFDDQPALVLRGRPGLSKPLVWDALTREDLLDWGLVLFFAFADFAQPIRLSNFTIELLQIVNLVYIVSINFHFICVDYILLISPSRFQKMTLRMEKFPKYQVC